MAHPLALLVLLMQVPAPDAANEQARLLQVEHRTILDREAEKLSEFAAREAKLGHDQVAQAIRGFIETPPPGGSSRFRPLPQFVTAENLAIDSTIPAEVRDLRAKSAASLFEIARKAASPKTKNFALADACLRDVLSRSLNHAEARRLIGFLPYRGGWATPHAKQLLEGGKILHPKFGWVDKAWASHLDMGELPSRFDTKGKALAWLPAEEVDTQHADWEKAWQIKTAPHFEIRTNVPLSEAIAFGRHLEELYELFLSEFADVIGPESLPLARRFANPAMQPTATPKKFQVWYFANKQEYVNFFRTEFNRLEDQSLGYYMPPQEAMHFGKVPPRSYFYKDDKYAISALATLFHEGSHQILFETVTKASVDEKSRNFWIWEGLGTYFETMTPQEDGSILIGQLAGPRIEAAKIRILNRGEFVPLEDLCRMDKEQFLNPANEAVNRHYAEAMALTVFFLHGKQAQYRSEFLDFLADACRGRARSRPLEERLDVPFKELNAQFLEFLK